MHPDGESGRKRSASPQALCYESDGGVDEVPVVYGIGSTNSSSRVDLFRMDLAPRKVPRYQYDSDSSDFIVSNKTPSTLRRDADRNPRPGNRQIRNRSSNDRRLDILREPCTPADNQRLVELIAHYLTSVQINPYNGSVPVERIQNVIRDKQGDLYMRVVGVGRNSWGKFLERNGHVLRMVTDGEKKRLCLRTQRHWEEGDRLEAEERLERESYLLQSMFQFFQLRGTLSCKVDEFMAAYPSLPIHVGKGRTPDLPARGDFVRFVKRHSYNFTYHPKDLEVVLRSTVWPPPKDP